MKALMIEFDMRTGERAGKVNPRDPHLPSRGWQNLESKPALEIRLVTDDRDLSQYQGVNGVTILDGKDEINAAITANIPTRYGIFDMTLFVEAAKEKGIQISTFAGKSASELAEYGFNQGLAGARATKPQLLEE